MTKKRVIIGLLGCLLFISCGPSPSEKKKMEEQKRKSSMDTSFMNDAIKALGNEEESDSSEADRVSSKAY